MEHNAVHKNDKDMSLPGIFGVEALELLTEKLSDATGFSFTVIDYRGNNLTEGIICNKFCEFHKELRECSECQVTAAFAAAKAAIKCCPYLFSCPQGLYSIAVPVIVNDQYLGALVGGRIRCDEEAEGEESRPDDSSVLYSDSEYANIPVFSRTKIMAIGDLMFFMLKEMGEKESMGMQLSTVSLEEAQIDNIREWNRSLQEKLKSSELKHLRAHIHPQFLMNMFATIANYAVLEDAVHTEELIVEYASILRYYLDESAEFCLIGDEFKQIEKYLSVLRLKYDNKFNYHIKLDESLKQVRFPVLVFFPLLGYVINYGAFPNSFKGILFIDGESDGDWCIATMQLENQIHVSESKGPGQVMIMDEEMIRAQLADTRKRLDYVYGDHYQLDMKPDMITLRFPKNINNMEVRG